MSKYVENSIVLLLSMAASNACQWVVAIAADRVHAKFASIYGMVWSLATVAIIVFMALWIINFVQWTRAHKRLRNSITEGKRQ